MRFILIDDHHLFREGIAQLLRAWWPQCDVRFAGNASSGIELAREGADLILLDLGLPEMRGAEALTLFRRHFPAIPVVVVTASDSRLDIEASLRAGASAYVGKYAPPGVLMKTLERVMAGEIVFPVLSAKRPGDYETRGLTARQSEVLRLMCEGRTNKEIAQQINVGEATVKTHVTAIFQALGVINRTQAVLAAQRYGWASMNAGLAAPR